MLPRVSVSIDRGGTFTDVFARVVEAAPGGEGTRTREVVLKLLSEDPEHYADAPTEAIRRVLASVDPRADAAEHYAVGRPVDSSLLEEVRMGTTVATNALLERRGERMALVTTRGFGDLLVIGNQSRPRIFDLEIRRPELLYDAVVELDERVQVWTQANGLDATADEASTFASEEELAAGGGRSVVVGTTGERVRILRALDEVGVRAALQPVLASGIRAIAICLAHSYAYAEHELLVGRVARELGFTHVSLSSELTPVVKLVSRGFTACADAYLTPCIQRYLRTFTAGFDADFLSRTRVSFMQSDGGLTDIDRFCGFRAILSGPAGGVVGYATTTPPPTSTLFVSEGVDAPSSSSANAEQGVIGFDMGGTSTDVSRVDERRRLEHVFETTLAGVTIQAPQLDITTVAAGGGSRLFFRAGLFQVGPESAGAHPGPACYRKGGPLTVTDANLFLGRLLPQHFPHIFGETQDQPLDVDRARALFEQLTAEVNAHPATVRAMTPHEVALGFVAVANESMCRPIRAITSARGHDVTRHALSCFGGAGGQHACAIARTLGIRRVFVHHLSGVLSAYGMARAEVVHEAREPCGGRALAADDARADLRARLERLTESAESALRAQSFDARDVRSTHFLHLRFEGTDTALMMEWPSDASLADVQRDFVTRYRREFGFVLERPVVVDDVRVRAVASKRTVEEDEVQATPLVAAAAAADHASSPEPIEVTPVVFEVRGAALTLETAVHRVEKLARGAVVRGPAILLSNISTLLVEPGCVACVTASGVEVLVSRDVDSATAAKAASSAASLSTNPSAPVVVVGAASASTAVPLDMVLLSLFSHRFMSIAEQMGRTLQRTALSVNIKERLDFSCALFGPDGGLVANAPHLPVHLGSMQEAVRFQVQHLAARGGWREGEVVLSNHPSAGGSHLPDMTVITPVFRDGRPVFFVASRGHHSDIGGPTPGSMPPFSQSLRDEGAAILSFVLVRADGQFDVEGVSAILREAGTRNLRDNLSDLHAQVAANQRGIQLVGELIEQYSLSVVQSYMHYIQRNAELAVREMLRALGRGRLHAVDQLDDGTRVELTVDIDTTTGDAVFDFTGTGAQVLGNLNAPVSITKSAVIYCLRCLVRQEIPLNQGCLDPIRIVLPPRSLLSPTADAAVVGGNVLTSQRVTDVILRAFDACAASQGCMNNLTFGNSRFGYYETICGGAGAGPTWHGASGVHTHMTNTRITDIEVLERRYPVMVREFSLRAGSGGRGHFRGGDGVVRELEVWCGHTPASEGLVFSILSERRAVSPWGLAGGGDAERGRNFWLRRDGTRVYVGAKAVVNLSFGDRFRIESPGGGGYGAE